MLSHMLFSAAFVSSLFGGLLGAVVLTFFLLVARPLILAFGLPEMLMITILGLSMVAILAGRIPLKGIVAAGLGLGCRRQHLVFDLPTGDLLAVDDTQDLTGLRHVRQAQQDLGRVEQRRAQAEYMIEAAEERQEDNEIERNTLREELERHEATIG